VRREDEFSPLKNADGAKSETPTTCRQDLESQHKRWLQKIGIKFELPNEVEISPLVSYEGEVF
jgi:UDP-N-acetylglucosamine/UDP-N-acetylgalactosamine diphosphorylase